MSDPPNPDSTQDPTQDAAASPMEGPASPGRACDEAEPVPQEGPKPVRRWRPSWRLVVGICLILAAVIHYVRTGYQPRSAVLLGRTPQPIEVPPDLEEVDALPAERGDLAGCNVLLVTFDTTRADRIGCYGNKDIKTPTMDSLAGEGVLFSTAIAASPTTVPSHASILTGLYPEHHEAIVNGLYSLKDEHQTLAETLAEQGYKTGAVISSLVLNSRCGTDQGFSDYDDDLSDCVKPEAFMYQERQAGPTTERAVKWLRGAADDPFFLWVHYWDPHAQYDPPSPYAEEYSANPYDGEIAYADAELGKLIAVVDELGLTDQTLVVVVADHGDSLGQHSELTHAFLTYEATLRVPLIMRCGQRLGGGVHVKHRVSHVDIVPTLHTLLGLDPPLRTDGVDLTQGSPPSRPIFSETRHGLILFGWAGLLAVYQGPDKYIYGPKPELYDLSSDPNEQNNIIESNPQRAEELRQELVGLFGQDLDMAEVVQPTEELSHEEIEQLQALGYGGTPANLPAPSERPNPRDVMPVMLLVEQIMFTPGFRDNVEKRIARLEKIVEDHPTFHPAFRFLADLCRFNNQPAKAVKNYTRCLEINRDPTSVYGLAMANLQLNNPTEAKKYLQELVDRYADHLNARYLLGMLAGQANDYDTAIEHFGYIFEADPDFVQEAMQPAALQMVQAYVLADRGEELPGILEPKLEAFPRSPQARAALAWYYGKQDRFAEAEALLRQGVELMPDSPAAITNLAMFLVNCRDPKFRKPYEGVAMVERLCEQKGYQDPELLSSLSMIYSMMRRMDEAIAAAEKAKTLATEKADVILVQGLDQLLERLRAAKAAGVAPAVPPSMDGL